MKPALLLIDLQRDFLSQRGLSPKPAVVIAHAAMLLERARDLGLPVFHIHTQVRRDGSDRMPHWQRENTWLCVEGTPGVTTPDVLQPRAGEVIVHKQFFSGFGPPDLHAALREKQVDTLIVAGVHLHGCVRATVFDAYERGYEVWVADEAVTSREPDHAELTRTYLEGRAATFLATDAILARLGSAPAPMPQSSPSEIADASTATQAAQQRWCRLDLAERVGLLLRWADVLSDRAENLADLLVSEIGKPLRDSRDEVRRAIELIRATAEIFRAGPVTTSPIHIRSLPHGVVGLITPWNNPIAIPVGKIAPALAAGNGVVWKPALEAPGVAAAVLDSVIITGLPSGLVHLVSGQSATARSVIRDPRITAISLTGSVATGRAAAALCTRYGKPLQAELGGNNAAIILRDFDFRTHAHALALSSFSFAGQRCTRIQRFIVEREIAAPFQDALVAAITALRVGDPRDPATEVGPVISKAERDRVRHLIEDALKDGAQLLCGGTVPAEFAEGCWLTPALLSGLAADSRFAQEEIFGPVALLLVADDLTEAITVANSVEHGLVAALHTHDPAKQQEFLEAIEAGLVQLAPGPLPVHPHAPFGGWKASRLGPPEHGVWDREFYSRVQAIYGSAEP